MTDIHFIYSAADENALEARRLYGEWCPSRCLPDRKILERLHGRLGETGSFVSGMHDTGCTMNARTPEHEEHVLREFEEQPETNMPAASTTANVSQITVWRVLAADGFRPYYVEFVHILIATDHQPHVDFSRWFLQNLAAQLDFSSHVLLNDECNFSREGLSNARNAHNWAYTHATRPHLYQRRFSVNMWAGIIDDHLIGPYLLPRCLDGGKCVAFLQEVLPFILQCVPANMTAGMWFQHDGAPAHFSEDVRNALDAAYPGVVVR